MKYGVQLFSLRKYLKDENGYKHIFAKVKAMGAEVVQISCTFGTEVGADTIKRASEEYELPVCVTHSPYSRIVNDLDTLIEEHLSFGCKEIGIGMMPKEFRQDSFSKLDEFISSLNTASNRLKKSGMTLAYHNHWFEFNKLDGKTVFDRLIEETDVNFIPDTYWIKVGGEEPSEFLKKLNGRVNTLHLKDYKKSLRVPVFRSLGKGTLDFDGILSTAEQIGVSNSVVELDISLNPLKSIEGSMRYLDRYKK